MSRTYAVIMAGGIGKRLRPLSTEERPKQFLPLLGDRTMLQATVDRILPIVPLERVLVVTGARHAELVVDQLPGLPRGNLIVEPIARGTAACIGLAALHIAREDPEAVMLALPADHAIEDDVGFRRLLEVAIAAASGGEHLITLGIDPDGPSTEYGYIEACGPNGIKSLDNAFSVQRVERFTEKPNRETAEAFLETGRFYWNSGMFIWRVDRVLGEIREKMPSLGAALEEIKTASCNRSTRTEIISRAFEPLESISIDFGVMEKSDRVLVVATGDIGWSDVGSFDALRDLRAFTEKPWGHEILWALTSHYAGKILHVNAGESLSLQFHEAKEETIRILTGTLRLRWGEDGNPLQETILEATEQFHIRPRMRHQMEAVSDCDVLEVSTPQLLDVVRLEDRYGRAEGTESTSVEAID